MSDIIHNPQVIRICCENERRFRKFREMAAPDLQPALAEEFGIVQSLVSKLAHQDMKHRKITDEQVAEIRTRLIRGRKNLRMSNRFSQRETARRLGIATGSVSRILAIYSTLSKRATLRPRNTENPITRFLTMRTPAQERHHEAT